MKKELSVATIIYDKSRNKILCAHSTGKTYGEYEGGYDIPKGHFEDSDGEYENTAVRETFEETGLKLAKDKLVYLGRTGYTNNKDLEWFYIRLPKIDLRTLKCTSYFERDGKEYPEVNHFKLIDPFTEEINDLFPVLRPLVQSRLMIVFREPYIVDKPETLKELESHMEDQISS
jgi:8-oxo-dGTP pyrophosphatase MutT (NUDIX family)